MTLPKHTPFTRLPRWVRWPLLLWLLLGLFPVLVAAFGFPFLPSPEWVAKTRILALLSGLAMAVLMTMGVAMGIEINSQKTGKIKKLTVILFAPVMGMFIGSASVSSAVPLMVAMATGADAEIQYTVAKVTGRNFRGCRNPISLEGLPLMANKFCGFPAEIRSNFGRGDTIIVTGRGTA
ncbi:MAG: hypothetical protein GQ535_08735, partial [Rhodobacteraceae bacterium]|nr:hypothetical protein [Paracoccaceae bacterium]